MTLSSLRDRRQSVKRTVDATITRDNDGAADDGTIANNPVDANDGVAVDVGTATSVSVTVYDTVNAE
jgi:hypothetical protein